jgi:hypothetical protein
MDPSEVLDCRWIPLKDVTRLQNPILQRVAHQLLFGLEHGFAQSIDNALEQIPSIVTGISFNVFIRPIKANQ